MSSCFTVDVSVDFANEEGVSRYCNYGPGVIVYKLRAHKAIIAGSGAYQNSTMHSGIGHVNYVSYRVRRIKFEADYVYIRSAPDSTRYPDYAVLFKVPYRDPVVNDIFTSLNDFILYKEPEKVLGYDILKITPYNILRDNVSFHFSIDITKPFIVGPNDYVGVFYYLTVPGGNQIARLKHSGTATVWFDPV